ncbi:MAG: hypothetical protein EBX36_00950 [Planctomycetia bacterium]|nr:hypothetical protein [Planctomycetia bacterium]
MNTPGRDNLGPDRKTSYSCMVRASRYRKRRMGSDLPARLPQEQVCELGHRTSRALEVEFLRQRAANPRLQGPCILRTCHMGGDLAGEVQQVVDPALHRQQPLPADRQRIDIGQPVKLLDSAGKLVEIDERLRLPPGLDRPHLRDLTVDGVRLPHRRPRCLGREESLPDAYLIAKWVPNKIQIKQDLKAGAQIPHCELVEKMNIQIK